MDGFDAAAKGLLPEVSVVSAPTPMEAAVWLLTRENMRGILSAEILDGKELPGTDVYIQWISAQKPYPRTSVLSLGSAADAEETVRLLSWPSPFCG